MNLRLILNVIFLGVVVFVITFMPGCGGITWNGGQQILQYTVTINIGAAGKMGAAYGVNPLVVQFGTQVTWINNDTMPHTVTSDAGVWDSGTIEPGQIYRYTFNRTGNYPYHCTIHGAASMTGTVVVNP